MSSVVTAFHLDSARDYVLREELGQREMLGVVRERRKGFGTVLELVGEQVLADLLGGHAHIGLLGQIL